MGKAPAHAKPPAPAPARTVADALFSRTQQRVFSLVFGQPERAFGMSELIALAGSGSGAVQREVQKLLDSKLIVATRAGRQKRYQANHAAPIFQELHSIVEKTAGVPGRLRAALAPLAERVQLALLYGSVAKQTDTAMSDIDVLVVSDDLTLEEVFTALQDAERDLGRSVSPTLYTSDEFRRRRRSGHPFLTRVLDGPHIVLAGVRRQRGRRHRPADSPDPHRTRSRSRRAGAGTVGAMRYGDRLSSRRSAPGPGRSGSPGRAA